MKLGIWEFFGKERTNLTSKFKIIALFSRWRPLNSGKLVSRLFKDGVG